MIPNVRAGLRVAGCTLVLSAVTVASAAPLQSAGTPASSPASEVPAETAVITYQNGVLQVDSKTSTLTELLTAIQAKTRVRIDDIPGSKDPVFAEIHGSVGQVIADLLSGSPYGYILVMSRKQPGEVAQVIIKKQDLDAAAGLGTMTPAAGQMTGRRAALAAMRPEIRPVDLEESANIAAAAAQQAAVAAAEPAKENAAGAAVAAAEPATAEDAAGPKSTPPAQPGKAAAADQVSPAALYMEELYKRRIEQQSKSPAEPAAPAPQ